MQHPRNVWSVLGPGSNPQANCRHDPACPAAVACGTACGDSRGQRPSQSQLRRLLRTHVVANISDLLKKVDQGCSRGSRWPESKLILDQEVHWWFDQCRVDKLTYNYS